MRVLGLSVSGDSAAALIRDGAVVAAAQEERFTRRKHDAAFPAQAMAYCLAEAGCRLRDLDLVAVHGDAAGMAGVPPGRLWAVPPALAHAASAFFPSPFAEAAVLVADPTVTALGLGSGGRLDILRQRPAPHSLGRFYSAITAYLGFKEGSGEYKVMGLAPYGEPVHAAAMLDRLIEVGANGEVRLGSESSAEVFGRPARQPEGRLTRFHRDVAASVQAVAEQVMLALARAARAESGARHLCLGGGVALNCVANGHVLRAGLFDGLWVQPAAGDAGAALGAALAGYHLQCGRPRGEADGDAMQGGFLGPAWGQGEVEGRLAGMGARFTVLEDGRLLDWTAEALAGQQAVGWVQGRMEFGPRALGNRSILADPRSPAMRKVLNLKVKFREGFRPFAPSVPREDAAEWFDLAGESPYMLLVAPVAGHRRGDIPAVTHVDGSARVQTVEAATNPRFHALLAAFKARTGCPVLVNTSFNVRGEPIVHTPEDAFRCFMGSGIEALVVGNCVLRKEDQDPGLAVKAEFEPD